MTNMVSPAHGIRQRVIAGGSVLAVRQICSICIALLGSLLFTRALGPAAYGLYAGANRIAIVAYSLCQGGLGVYLVTAAPDESRSREHQVFTILLLISALALSVVLLALCYSTVFAGVPGYRPAIIGVAAALPVMLAALVPQAMLEKRLAFKELSTIEVLGQVLFVSVGSLLAFKRCREWSLVIAFWLQQSFLCGAYSVAARYRPRLVWNRASLRALLKYGTGYTASLWAWQGRYLVNPLIVARTLGAEAMGIVALVVQAVDAICFVRNALSRLSISALSTARNDVSRLSRAVAHGTSLQVAAVGLMLSVGAILIRSLVPTLLGPNWTKVGALFPYIAVASLVNAMFNLQCSALYVTGRAWSVTLFNLVNVGTFALAAAVLIPRYGTRGYGLAEIAALSSYAALAYLYHRAIGIQHFRLPAVWGASCSAALLFGARWPVAWCLALAPLAVPDTMRTAHDLWSLFSPQLRHVVKLKVRTAE